MATELERVRRTKDKLRESLRNDPRCVGIGITRVGNLLAVKINWREGPCEPGVTTVDGVPVVNEVVGPIKARRLSQPRPRGSAAGR